jgi:hypothetical protein
MILAVLPVAILLSVPALVPAKGGKSGGGGGAGKIYISPKACPDSVYKKNNGNALIGWFKSNKKFEVWENKEEEVKAKCDERCADEASEEKTKKCHDKCMDKESGWDFWILIHLAKPLDDLELSISFYDVEQQPKHHINSFSMMLYKKGDKILTQRIRIYRPDFEADHRYQIEVSSKKVRQAQQDFNLRGTPIVYSGEVDFSDD